MKISVRTIVESHQSISVLLAAKLPATVGYEIALLWNRIKDEYSAWEKVNNQKVCEYGKEIDGVFTVTPWDKNMPLFTKEMEPILSKEIDVEVPMIRISDLVDREKNPIEIEPIHLLNLVWLIKK